MQPVNVTVMDQCTFLLTFELFYVRNKTENKAIGH